LDESNSGTTGHTSPAISSSELKTLTLSNILLLALPQFPYLPPIIPRLLPIDASGSPTQIPMAMPSPSLDPAGPVRQILKFNGYSEFSGLLCHSPHSLLYKEELYPTALHLFEAHKFLDHRPDLADHIKECERVEDVTSISAELAEFTRRDWSRVGRPTVSEPFFHVSCVSRVCLVSSSSWLIAVGGRV